MKIRLRRSYMNVGLRSVKQINDVSTVNTDYLEGHPITKTGHIPPTASGEDFHAHCCFLRPDAQRDHEIRGFHVFTFSRFHVFTVFTVFTVFMVCEVFATFPGRQFELFSWEKNLLKRFAPLPCEKFQSQTWHEYSKAMSKAKRRLVVSELFPSHPSNVHSFLEGLLPHMSFSSNFGGPEP